MTHLWFLVCMCGDSLDGIHIIYVASCVFPQICGVVVCSSLSVHIPVCVLKTESAEMAHSDQVFTHFRTGQHIVEVICMLGLA